MSSDLYESAASPCVNICELDAGQVCTGCGRSLGEIAEWSAADDRRRRAIRADAAGRLAIIESATSSSSYGANRR